MNTLARCPECGIPLPADAPAGLCPKCLVQAGLESEPIADAAPQPTVSSPASAGFVPPTVEGLAGRFPQLEILELVGRGGMGAVYKARQKGLDRIVAVKILPPEVGRDPSFAQRFTREARALALLSHPNIVAVHDFGQTGGLFYFVMEFIDGTNLRQAMLAGQLRPEQALAIVPQICDALQYAHDEGVVHRDIKPENILLDKRGRVKIADFGLSKLVGADGTTPPEMTLTGTHQVMGTVRYMAPEQMEGTKAVDHRADIYSLGVVFYEMLTGELPLGRFAPPSQKVQVDVRLDEVVLRTLEKEPQRRYQQASDVKSEVEAITRAVPPRPTSTAETSTAKDETAEDPAFTAGASSKLLAIALSLAFGGLLALVGIILISLGFFWLPESGARWGFVAGGGGVLLGGLGSIFGTWRNYCRFRGVNDGISDAVWNGLDTFFLLIALIGLAMATAGGMYWSRLGIGAALTLLILGTMVGLNGAWFSVWRWAVRQATRQPDARDRLDPRLMLLAAGMLLSAVSMIGGLALAIIGFLYQPGGPDEIGGWLGGACGFFFGGVGGLVGAWNAYCRLEGAEDIWASEEVTWFDRVIVAAGILGLALFAAALIGPDSWHRDLRWGLGIIGGAVIIHVAAFALIRALVLRGARQQALQSCKQSSEVKAALEITGRGSASGARAGSTVTRHDRVKETPKWSLFAIAGFAMMLVAALLFAVGAFTIGIMPRDWAYLGAIAAGVIGVALWAVHAVALKPKNWTDSPGKVDSSLASSGEIEIAAAGIAASDGVVFVRLCAFNLLIWLVWSALLGGLHLGYLSDAEWYFQKELPYEYLSAGWKIVSLLFAFFFGYWWYLLTKSPQTERSFSDAWRCLQTPDRRAIRLWIPGGIYLVAWVCIMAVTMNLASDAVQSTAHTVLFIGVPLVAAGSCWWAYRERIGQLLN